MILSCRGYIVFMIETQPFMKSEAFVFSRSFDTFDLRLLD